MIKADMHMHTMYSHGAGTPAEMYESAQKKNLEIIGFSEHSPRPLGYDYSHEYREKLSGHFDQYISETRALQDFGAAHKDSCQVLVGMEMDWLNGEAGFIKNAIHSRNFDFLLGSVHFLDKWGFDDGDERWKNATQEECEGYYRRYFELWKDMLASGLFQIAAHPDLIKIFSVRRFHIWMDKPESQSVVRQCLETLRNSDMIMEISSAGLRKPCREIYPCPQIMKMAAELDLPVSFASDAHCPKDVGFAFDRLAEYAKNFGFDKQAIFDRGKKVFLSF